MAGINFIPNQTTIPSSWLNVVNSFVYDLFQSATTSAAARSAIGAMSSAGDNVSGNYTINGNITVTSNTNANVLNATRVQAGGVSLTSTGYAVKIVDTANAPFAIEEYGSTDGGVVRGFRARGTPTAPTPPLNGDIITALRGLAFTNGSTANRAAAIDMIVIEDVTSTASGGRIEFHTTTPGTLTDVLRGYIDNTGLHANDATFTNSLVSPTRDPADNSNYVANTQFVKTALTSYAPLASPAFTGHPTGVTESNGDNSTRLATTQYVANNSVSTVSPVFTGTPTAPTPLAGDSTFKLATTEFVHNSFNNSTLIGTPTAPTASSSTYSTQIATTAFVQTVLPIGVVLPFANSTVPGCYLECNGAAVSRTTYSGLFTAIGTTYGSGDGSTTFNVPDLRGYFVRGWDHSRGVDSGRAIGTTQTDSFKSHVHTIDTSQFSNNTPQGFVTSANSGGVSINTGSTGGGETRPLNVSMMYCIKFI